MQGRVDPEVKINLNTENTRLYYIDLLRVLAIFGVFLFHSSSVFNTLDFHIQNVDQSDIITIIQAFFVPWGMPLFFTIAGAGTWFALRRRMATEYMRERTNQFLTPSFVVHQPVIIVIAYFVVQWIISLLLKLVIVILGSFLVSIGFYELVVKRIGILSMAFSVKSKRLKLIPDSMN